MGIYYGINGRGTDWGSMGRGLMSTIDVLQAQEKTAEVFNAQEQGLVWTWRCGVH